MILYLMLAFLADGFVGMCRRALQYLISETVVFVHEVQSAEAHPEAESPQQEHV